MAAVTKEKSKRANTQAETGIIGGSGLYSMNGLTKTREIRVKTPFGEPSDAIVLGTLEGQARGISCAARAWPSHSAGRDQLSRERLRHEAAWAWKELFPSARWGR